MSIAICPGSFDPITLGHLNIIRRTSRIFDEVVVLVMVNSNKSTPMFSIEERLSMVSRAVERYPNVDKKINPDLETMFLTSSEKYTFLSSSVVREMARYGGDLTGLVPRELIDEIEEKAKAWREQNG